MKVPLANSVPPGDPAISVHRSYDCLPRDKPPSPVCRGMNDCISRERAPSLVSRPLSHSLLDPCTRAKLSDTQSEIGVRRTSRLPSQQHDPDSWLVGNGQERVAWRIRCVYCGAILGCVLGLALLVGAGLSLAIYLGCLSIEQQRSAWLKKLKGETEVQLESLRNTIKHHEQRQHEQQAMIGLQFKYGVILAGLGVLMLTFGIFCCCIHPAATERRRRTCSDCLPRPHGLKLTTSASNVSSPRTRKSTPLSPVRNERSVSTSAASPQHYLSVTRGHCDDESSSAPSHSFLRRFSFL